MERFALWMMQNGFATGHGDTIEDLEAEASAEIKRLHEQRDRAISMLRNARNILESGGYVYVREIDRFLEKPDL